MFFCPNRIRTLVAMAIDSFHCLIMGKSGNWQFLLSHCRYLDFFLQKRFLSSHLWFIWILSKSLNLIGCNGNIKGTFSKKIKQSTPPKLFGGWSWNIAELFLTIASTKLLFFIAVAKASTKAHWLTMGKRKIEIYCSHCRYFDKSFTEMFLE